MRIMMLGLTGWMKMEGRRSEAVQITDTALTVVGTLLIATTWAMFH